MDPYHHDKNRLAALTKRLEERPDFSLESPEKVEDTAPVSNGK
jgi:hypothetical protein